MHLTILTLGSRGDVQPFIPLGLGLQAAGYDVKLATFEVFGEFVRNHGLSFAPIQGDPRTTMTSQDGQAWMTSGQNIAKATKGMSGALHEDHVRASFEDVLEVCRGTDAILYSFMGAAAYHVAEKLEVPSIFTLLQPFTRTRLTPSLIAPNLPLGGSYNMLTHRISEGIIWMMVARMINRWRVESLGLPSLGWRGPFDQLYAEKRPYLYGFSPSVVPRQADFPFWHHISGYWFLERDPTWSPPDALIQFLQAGPKPISIGFGSMTGRKAEQLLEISVEAVKLAGQRAVLLGGWAQQSDLALPETIFQIDSIPHDWLFPRMAAVVHHGGSGTTAAGLRAGVPSILVPFFGDQPFWGRRVYGLGAGPRPIQLKSLNTSNLTAALSLAIEDEEMQHNAAVLGQRIRAEDGVQSAVEFISAYLSR